MADPNSLLFRPSVVIETSRAGRLRAVGSVREATELLLGDWPAENRGSAWRNACEAAHAALAGTLEPNTARKAFIAAAKEAGILRGAVRR